MWTFCTVGIFLTNYAPYHKCSLCSLHPTSLKLKTQLSFHWFSSNEGSLTFNVYSVSIPIDAAWLLCISSILCLYLEFWGLFNIGWLKISVCTVISRFQTLMHFNNERWVNISEWSSHMLPIIMHYVISKTCGLLNEPTFPCSSMWFNSHIHWVCSKLGAWVRVHVSEEY